MFTQTTKLGTNIKYEVNQSLHLISNHSNHQKCNFEFLGIVLIMLNYLKLIFRLVRMFVNGFNRTKNEEYCGTQGFVSLFKYY